MLMTESNKYDIKDLNEMVESSNLKLEHAIRQMDMVGSSRKLNEKKKLFYLNTWATPNLKIIEI